LDQYIKEFDYYYFKYFFESDYNIDVMYIYYSIVVDN